MNVVFDERAVADLEGIYAWIAQDSPAAARTVVARVLSSIERLGVFPDLGRLGRAGGTREWVVPRLPYIVVYETHPDRGELTVIAVFHGARSRPSGQP